VAGSITVTTSKAGGLTKYSIAWTSDASGNVSANTLNIQNGELLQVGFVPGAGGSQPTDLYDVTFLDPNSVEIFGTVGADRSNANASVGVPVVGTYFRRILEAGAYTPVVANAGNAKSGTIVLLVRPA